MLNYNATENHISTRDGLPISIRSTLLEEAKSDWSKHPAYAKNARFFMNIHRQLINKSQDIANTLEKMLDIPDSDIQLAINQSKLIANSRHLFQFAHGHHQIEDHNYFPQFIRLQPSLEQAFELMDGDHNVIETTLHNAEQSLNSLAQNGTTRDRLAEFYKHSKGLNKIITRHIRDEEEVIIPIFLRHG
ncbi:MAG: hemerythrin domain-containing protein [Rhizobiales bacterium]|nr:hemerythrin domain-containing protein [Hyphomicrobiales bacterium]